MVIPCLHDSISFDVHEYESINKNISTELNCCFFSYFEQTRDVPYYFILG